MFRPLRILLSNDDGIQAPGLFLLKQALERAGHAVFVCAPEKPRSACSHAITLHKPLRASEYGFSDGTTGFAVSGNPADCVVLGLDDLVGPVDLVVSGVNHGPNLGWDVIYSGTVAAAMEAVILGFPGIAVSTASYAPRPCYETAARVVAERVVAGFLARGLPHATLLNVNVPDLSYDALRGVRVTVQGERHYKDRMEKRIDPNGRPYYWIGGQIDERETADDTDLAAVNSGFVSVTPIDLDLTNRAFLPDLAGWGL